MKSIVLRSPAKLNLFLRVLSKRSDGYHNLLTLFERIDLADVIRFSLNKDGKIRINCLHPHVPRGPKNIIYRTAQLLKDDLRISQGADIHIQKRIPVAAGLGGGSSNAATALIALNRLWNLKLPKSKLVAYAKRLGSDVPLFLYDCSWAVGTHRGDVIRPLKLGKKLWHVLVVPRLKVYSAQVFRAHKMRLTKGNDDVNILLRALRKNDVSHAGRLLLNDLETTIIRLHPNLFKLRKKLESCQPAGVVFSGSGPAVFALVDCFSAARKITRQLKRIYSQVFVVRTL